MSGRSRSLWPREHGAYVQLVAPIAAALIAAPSVSGAAIAIGACLAFLAVEPLRILVGDRGPRLRVAVAGRARRRLAALGVAALLAGSLGLALAPRVALAQAALIAVAIAALLLLARRRLLDTVVGEALAAITLAAAAAPVAAAGGVSAHAVLWIWAAWSLGHIASVVAVHHVLARHRRPAPIADLPRALALVVLCIVIATLAARDPLGWTAAPFAVIAIAITIRPPRATRLRAVGIAFTIGALAAAIYTVAAVRTTTSPVLHGDLQ